MGNRRYKSNGERNDRVTRERIKLKDFFIIIVFNYSTLNYAPRVGSIAKKEERKRKEFFEKRECILDTIVIMGYSQAEPTRLNAWWV